MAARAFWKGYLKLSLVTCPVAMIPATTENEKVRFHILNRKTGNRAVSQYVDAETGRPVEEDEEAKGYPLGEEEHVILEDDELASVDLESTHTIDIETFTSPIDWLWREKPYFLLPDDPVGVEAFCVVRDAMKLTNTVAVSRLVMNRRERAVMLEPRGKGVVLWTLRYAEELRNPDEYFRGIAAGNFDPAMLSLISRLIDERRAAWSPEMTRDPVQERLLELIGSKKRRRRASPKAAPQPTPTPSNVVSIMDALKKSLRSKAKPEK